MRKGEVCLYLPILGRSYKSATHGEEARVVANDADGRSPCIINIPHSRFSQRGGAFGQGFFFFFEYQLIVSVEYIRCYTTDQQVARPLSTCHSVQGKGSLVVHLYSRLAQSCSTARPQRTWSPLAAWLRRPGSERLAKCLNTYMVGNNEDHSTATESVRNRSKSRVGNHCREDRGD